MRLPDVLAAPAAPVTRLLTDGLSLFDGPVVVIGRTPPHLARAILATGLSPLDLHIIDPDATDAQADALTRAHPGLRIRRAGAAALADLDVAGAQAVILRFPVTRIEGSGLGDIIAMALSRLSEQGSLLVELRWLAPGLPDAVAYRHDLRCEASPLIWRGTPTRVLCYDRLPGPLDWDMA